MSGQISAEELKTRKNIKNNVRFLFNSENFAELNKLGSEYLHYESKTSSGLWKLGIFGTGLLGIINSSNPDPEYWKALKQKVQSWISVDPSLSFAKLFYANVLIQEAWMHRGFGYANKVRPREWEAFKAGMQNARAFLEKHAILKKLDPHWHYYMLQIANAQSWPPNAFLNLMDEAFSIHPTFYQNYFVAFTYFQPKWHGSTQAIEQFVHYAVEKSKKSEKNGMYARIYWYASQVDYGPLLFENSNVNWAKMKAGIDDVIAAYPDQWNINNFAYFACLAKDKAKTKELMSMMNGIHYETVWKKRKLYSACRKYAGLK